MTKIPKFKILFLFAAFCFLLSLQVANAARLDIISQFQKIAIGQQFQVDLILDTEDEDINAIEGRIIFSGDLLTLKEIRDGNSIINFWIDRPKITQTGVVSFSGIIPGGCQKVKGFLFSVVFRAKASGNGIIEIRDAKVLLNDGKGTPANVKISNFQFSISKETPSAPPMVETVKDIDPPEDFRPEIVQNSDMLNGQWFLVFATQDKGLGVDRYEIRETRREIKRETDTKWEIVEGPYILKDQRLRSFIYVKAVDKAGNSRIAVVEPRYPIKWYEKPLIWIIIVIAGIIAYLIWRKLKSQR